MLARPFPFDLTADMLLPMAALLTGVLAALHLLAFELPIGHFGYAGLPAVPFTDAGTIGAVALATASLAAGAIVGGRAAWRAPVLAAGVILAYLVPYEVAPWAVVILWAGLALLSSALPRLDPAGSHVTLGAAIILLGAAGTIAVDEVAPVSRLVVGDTPVEGVVAVQSSLALGALVIALIVLARAGRPRGWAPWTGMVAGATFVYLASVALVDVAATQVGGSVPLEQLRTWGQVGLSVLWAVLGLIAFVGGLNWRFGKLRHAGLVLLGLATIKVFLVDLSGLDVAYRVVSLIALGLLLLAGAWLWQRAQPREDAPPA